MGRRPPKRGAPAGQASAGTRGGVGKRQGLEETSSTRTVTVVVSGGLVGTSGGAGGVPGRLDCRRAGGGAGAGALGRWLLWGGLGVWRPLGVWCSLPPGWQVNLPYGVSITHLHAPLHTSSHLEGLPPSPPSPTQAVHPSGWVPPGHPMQGDTNRHTQARGVVCLG